MNDLKQKQLSMYLADDIRELAKKDEQLYLKAIQDKELKDRKKEEDALLH